jgi:hypothetical protein
MKGATNELPSIKKQLSSHVHELHADTQQPMGQGELWRPINTHLKDAQPKNRWKWVLFWLALRNRRPPLVMAA